jgi:hypothetical protein
MTNTNAPSTYTVDFALRMLADAIDFAEAEKDFTRARHCLKELRNSIEAEKHVPVPFEEAKLGEVVGYIYLPIRPMMLKGWTSGRLSMLYADMILSLTNDEGETVLEIGGRPNGGVHLKVGKNTFSVKAIDVVKAFVTFLKDNPDYYDCEDKEGIDDFIRGKHE